MQITGKARARMYALTALACALWLVQSLVEASKDGSLLHWSTIVFSLCLGVVTMYCGCCAWKVNRAAEKTVSTDTPASSESSQD
ncbi:carbon starvation protein [Bombiscardovia coagulans]|uniref:Carbon starvation protein n=1 Tax=Bombiscardovia coagulans TaxID=686666 RepID=A0A261EQ35_9BIFI|nr:carbon starvation protein [Bombiscardovia coagulans]